MRFRKRTTAPVRRGTVYIFVLALALIVLVIGMGSLAVVRAQNRVNIDQGDAGESQAYAFSAIELGRYLIASDPKWRTNRSNGTWLNNQPIGRGTLSLDVMSLNGDLNNSPYDSVILTGTGTKGQASHKVQVTLGAMAQPLTCLQSPIFANGAITLSSATVQNSAAMASNSTISASSSVVSGDVEAVGAISGGNYAARITAGATARTVPDATVFDEYVANGTMISFAVLPKVSGIATIDRKLISPSTNPYASGTTNSQGIYVIDCGGNPIVIQNSRIVGTLVILHAGAGSVAQGALVWSPAIANYPLLLVQGDFKIATSGTLSESGSPKLNFNPAEAPYNGVSNANTTDSFPAAFDGLIYCSGTLTINGSPIVNGVIVSGGPMTISATLVANYAKTFANYPPPGFGQPPKLVPIPGTWMQVVD